MEPTYEEETIEETVSEESDIADEPELEDVPETESVVESSEEDSVSVSENTVKTEVDSDDEVLEYEGELYAEMMSGADTEAIVLAINQQTEVIQKGNIAICAALGLLVGILLMQGFRLRRV